MTTELGRQQHVHWQSVYDANPHMYGDEASAPARHAAELFAADNASTVLEIGAGHGRDSLHFARSGFHVRCTDFSERALAQLRGRAERDGVADQVDAMMHDVRTPLPLPDESVDAVFAHMLACMALSTRDIHDLFAEVRRVLRPAGRFVYTVRHTGDAHYGTGIDHGDDIFENGGFAVHFFGRELVDSLARGWKLADVHPFEEGGLPRKLWRVDQVKVSGSSAGAEVAEQGMAARAAATTDP